MPEKILKIRRIISGPLNTNTYILSSDGKCIIIDAGGNQTKVLDDMKMNNIEPVAIIATHGHFDHVLGVRQIQERYDIPFFMNGRDMDLMESSGEIMEGFSMNIPFHMPENIREMYDGMEFKIGPHRIEVIETPGHTDGSCSLLSDGFILTGDTLFKLSVGRTDLGGNENDLVNSLKRIGKMKESTKIYPGHGDPTDLRFEILNNSFLKNAILKGTLY